ncbi:class I SAM-dependent methyltransferase [Nonomuraea fuscirosea]|uniref:class I SAM-dependent methyltransferase n=1 Tax=Nonomuraea fuscirosea TaxID=1291556 RepID=UPI0033EECC02
MRTDHWKSSTNVSLYDRVVERQRLARVMAWLLWGARLRSWYRELDDLGSMAASKSVLDVPCGGGVAFRGLRASVGPRYVAADLSSVMLDRARTEAARRGLTHIEFAQADVAHLPYPDETFDLCVSYNGLHCFPDPPSAVAEMARVLRAGGELIGTAIVLGAGRRQDAVIAKNRELGIFGRVGTGAEVRSWLGAAGFGDLRFRHSGAMLFFRATRNGSAGFH